MTPGDLITSGTNADNAVAGSLRFDRGAGQRRPSRDRGRTTASPPGNNRYFSVIVAIPVLTTTVSRQAAVAAISQQPKERPDANNHLKFTYGVNAWKHWVVGKNAELEKQRAQVIDDGM